MSHELSNVGEGCKSDQLSLLPMPTYGFEFHGIDFYRDFPRPLAINVSGGRSSAYQAWHFIEANGGVPDGVIFNYNNVDERPETLDFVDRLDRELRLDIHWLEYDTDSPTLVKRVSYETASRNGEPLDKLLYGIVAKRRDGTTGLRPLPNPAQRVCTAQTKIKTLHRYVRKHLGWPTHYHAAIGYRRDEDGRYKRRARQDAIKGTQEGGLAWCPMYHSGADKDRVDGFWRNAPFDLKIDSTHGNCRFCMMLSEWKIKERMLISAIEDQIKPRIGGPIPFHVLRWIEYEERECDRPGPFRRDRPNYRQMWESVCRGQMEGSRTGEQCQSCTD